METTPKCPTCKRALAGEAGDWPHRPFCSERCRSIDLGSWLDGAYKISAPLSEEDLDGAHREVEDDRSSDEDPAN